MQDVKRVDEEDQPKSLRTVQDTGLKAMIEACLAPADRRPSAAGVPVLFGRSGVLGGLDTLILRVHYNRAKVGA